MSIAVDLARKILEASKNFARETRSPVSIAIVDAGGHLVLFERMMAPYGFATGSISIAKAHTAVMFNQSTESVAQWASAIPGFTASLASMTDGKFILAAGGWPIRVNGVTIGGIGVSGGNAPGRDDEIARAGLAVLGPSLHPHPAPPVNYQPVQPPVQQQQPIANYAPTPPASFQTPSQAPNDNYPVQTWQQPVPPPSTPVDNFGTNGQQHAGSSTPAEHVPPSEEPPTSTSYLSSDDQKTFSSKSPYDPSRPSSTEQSGEKHS